MLRAILALALTVLSPASLLAEDVRLTRLDTGESGRGWEAVGRLDLGGRGFCTGALIAPDQVLTAAHCLYDKASGKRIDPSSIEFLAGWRNGRAEAYRQVRQAVLHPDYRYEDAASPERMRNDIALLHLTQPIRNTSVVPFRTGHDPEAQARVGVVSYARDRAEAPSLQEVCEVQARRRGVLVMDCAVDFGASGAPVFSFGADGPRIVSVVSGMAEMEGRPVSLGTALEAPVALLQGMLTARRTRMSGGDALRRVPADGTPRDIGAKFIRP
ncbi:MAG: trypsin-like serine peptidase [Paracoccaceae bacterium]